jgi:tetratricopeptide (TPR) repeat protein
MKYSHSSSFPQVELERRFAIRLRERRWASRPARHFLLAPAPRALRFFREYGGKTDALKSPARLIGMSPRPPIFISAVSGELRSARQLAANTLLSLGYEPIWQDTFPTEQGDLREMLRRMIDPCEGVIQLVGQCYGFEPPAPDAQFGRVSYTQCEALHARQQGKKVWYLLLDENYPADPHPGELEELRLLQKKYREGIESGGHLYHRVANPDALKSKIHELRDDLAALRRQWKRWALTVLVLLLVVVLSVAWLNREQQHTAQTVSDTQQTVRHTDEKVIGLVERYQKMEQALVKLADTEMHAKQLGEKLTPEQLRQRAYTILENDLGIAAGTLSKELPAFALELYNRPDTTLLMRARAAYALNKFEEAEKLFLESDAQDKKALENAQNVADKLRKQRIEALEGAGQSAEAQIQYARAVEHFRAAAALTDRRREALEWARVQHEIAYVLYDQGQYRDVEPILREVIKEAEKVLGREHPGTLPSRNNLANALYSQGKYAEAEAEHREVLKIKEKVFGPEHPDTLGSRVGVAITLDLQGKHAEAEAEFRAVLKIQEKVLGREHPNALATRNNLTNALYLQGRYAEAEAESRAVLKIEEKVLGPEHPDTLATRMNLAIAFDLQGKHAEAESEFRAVLKIQEKVLRPEHPDTLATRMGVAIALYSRGKYAEAEAENREVLKIKEKVLGLEHPNTLASKMGVANALASQGKYAEAEAENRAVIKIQENVLGPKHPHTLMSRNNLADTLSAQGKYAEAEKEHRAVLAIRERVLDPEHPDVSQSCFNLAIALRDQGKLEEAFKFMQRAEEGWRKVIGAEHPYTRDAQRIRKEIEAELEKKKESQ